jgi:predicted nucleic acid-binding protein
MTDRSFVDTSVWVYAVDEADPAKQARARALLEPAADVDLVISAQVLGEYYVIVTWKLANPVGTDQAKAMVERMSRLPTVPIDAGLVTAAIEGSERWQVSYWDALILAAAEASGCGRIYSEDLEHDRTYGSVTIVNPFGEAGAPPTALPSG